MLVATASDTSGPPPIESTQSRTMAKAGMAATTAPKPTRLATLSTGSTDALAPASTVSRSEGNRLRLTSTSVSDGQGKRHDHRPDAAHGRKRRGAPTLVRQEARVDTRQHHHGDDEIDDDHDEQWQAGDEHAG